MILTLMFLLSSCSLLEEGKKLSDSNIAVENAIKSELDREVKIVASPTDGTYAIQVIVNANPLPKDSNKITKRMSEIVTQHWHTKPTEVKVTWTSKKLEDVDLLDL